eukprot:217065-Ditylum_brightwellii.AAC.1
MIGIHLEAGATISTTLLEISNIVFEALGMIVIATMIPRHTTDAVMAIAEIMVRIGIEKVVENENAQGITRKGIAVTDTMVIDTVMAGTVALVIVDMMIEVPPIEMSIQTD